MSDCIKSENRGGEGSSEKLMEPNDLDDHIRLGESSNGEVKQDHGEERNKQSNQVDDTDSEQDITSQCDELLGNDECTTQAGFPASDSIKEALKQELTACLNRSGFRWVSLKREKSVIPNTLVVEFFRCPDENKAEDLKRELRLAMKDRELPIKFVHAFFAWECD